MSPAPPVVPGRAPPTAPQQRGTSPVNGGRQPMVVQNGPQVSIFLTYVYMSMFMFNF